MKKTAELAVAGQGPQSHSSSRVATRPWEVRATKRKNMKGNSDSTSVPKKQRERSGQYPREHSNDARGSSERQTKTGAVPESRAEIGPNTDNYSAPSSEEPPARKSKTQLQITSFFGNNVRAAADSLSLALQDKSNDTRPRESGDENGIAHHSYIDSLPQRSHNESCEIDPDDIESSGEFIPSPSSDDDLPPNFAGFSHSDSARSSIASRESTGDTSTSPDRGVFPLADQPRGYNNVGNDCFLIVVLQILPHLMLRIDKNRSLDTDAETLVTTMRNVICRPEGADQDYPSLALVKEALVRLVPKYGVCQMFAGGGSNTVRKRR